MRSFLTWIRVKTGAFFRNHKFFYFLNGLIIGVLFYFYSEDFYEQQIFGAIASNIREGLPAKQDLLIDTVIVRSLRITHNMEQNRQNIFGDAELRGFKAQLVQPVTYDLMTGRGACGSNAYVLARLLQEFKIPVRIGQMSVNGMYGGHIIVEAKVKNEWRVLDPLYELKFLRSDGQLAGFNEVKQQWDFYKKQLPANYNTAYKYEAIRYTNWNKIPVVMPALRSVIKFFSSESYVSSLSLRVWILRKFSVLYFISLISYILLLSIRYYIFRHKLGKNTRTLLKPVNQKIKEIFKKLPSDSEITIFPGKEK